METIVLRCRIIPSIELSKQPPKLKLSVQYTPKITDAHLRKLCIQGRVAEAISCLDSVTECGSTVRHATLSHLIESCIDSNSLDLCYKLHSRVRKLVKELNPFVETKLVSMYAKCGSLNDAYKVFDEMPDRNLYTWSAMIGACSREKRWGEVVKLFYWMVSEGNAVPDEFLFPKILQACGNCGDVETGRLIHGIVIKCGMNDELRVNNSILAVYAKCKWLDSARRFFEGMEVSDGVSWNAIITGYCQVGEIKKAHRLFASMHEKGIEPDVITWNILISSCSQLGQCDIAIKLMNEMKSCGISPDVFTWTSMILGFAQNNRRLDALNLFREMFLTGVEPNGVTLMSALSACSSLNDFRKGKEVHLAAIKLGYGETVLVGNSLIDMYSKCGKLDTARRIFDMIPEKDVYTWNSMIAGYCQAGYCGIAHDLFRKMQKSNLIPNVITWNVMITGYIHNGDEDQAIDLFQRMEKDGGVKRDTASWNALIAGYLHNGQKNKALRFFRKMQSCGVKPNSVTILSILPACANLIAIKKLKEIHGCVLHSNLDSEPSIANSMIDTYAKSGNINYSKAIFDRMPSKDIITWKSMISGYVLHGCSKEAIELYEGMKEHEYRPNRGTFGSIISAYGLAKMVDEGRRVFEMMTGDYQISSCLDHCAAMVNLYGRSGKLDEAFDFIESMAIEPDVSTWSALLTACRMHGNVKLAIHAAERLLELEPENTFIQRLIIQLYDLCGTSKDSVKINRPGIGKFPKESRGWSLMEDKNIVHTFVAGDYCQLDGKFVQSWIKSIESKAMPLKYCGMLDIQEEEKEENGGVHSEKVALAFALINSSQTFQCIRIVKNFRMCQNCHRFAKWISKAHVREIYLSDSTCLHHFKDGSCSCGDYW